MPLSIALRLAVLNVWAAAKAPFARRRAKEPHRLARQMRLIAVAGPERNVSKRCAAVKMGESHVQSLYAESDPGGTADRVERFRVSRPPGNTPGVPEVGN